MSTRAGKDSQVFTITCQGLPPLPRLHPGRALGGDGGPGQRRHGRRGEEPGRRLGRRGVPREGELRVAAAVTAGARCGEYSLGGDV